LATSDTTLGSMRVTSLVLALAIARQQPAGATRQIGHVGGPLIVDQIETARSRSQRSWSAATRALRLPI